jgi:hypothetical protein
VITAGQRGDSPQFEAVLEAIRVPRLGLGRPRKRPDRVRAGQGVRLSQQSLLSAQTRDQGHDPGPGGPGPQPAQARFAWRAAADLRQGRLQAAARCRVRDQSPQAPPGRRHAIRQTRCPLRSNRAGRSHQRVAVTSTFTTRPKPGSTWAARRYDPKRCPTASSLQLGLAKSRRGARPKLIYPQWNRCNMRWAWVVRRAVDLDQSANKSL